MKGWIRNREHEALIRTVLTLAQRFHEQRHGLYRRDTPAAWRGGPPMRLVPLPRPQHYDRAVRRQLAQLMRAGETSFADGPSVRRFERELARTFETADAVAVSSGTAALHTALLSLGVGPGDEVLVPALTHVATAMAVMQAGATPCFVDVAPDTWTLTRAAVEAAVGPKTRALVVVHLCGVPAEIVELVAWARGRGIAIVEDAAQAHGSRIGGRPLGGFGEAGCLSFQSTKTLSTGEGGAVLFHDPDLARRARLAMNLGERTDLRGPTVNDSRFDARTPLAYDQVGWNHRLGALQAAHGLARLQGTPSPFARACARLRAAREQIVTALDGHEELRFQAAPKQAEVVSGAVFFEVEPPLERNELARRLCLERIDVRLPYQRPLSEHAVFQNARTVGPMRVTQRICDRGLGLRLDAAFAPHDIRSIVRAVERALS